MPQKKKKKKRVQRRWMKKEIIPATFVYNTNRSKENTFTSLQSLGAWREIELAMAQKSYFALPQAKFAATTAKHLCTKDNSYGKKN